MPDRMNVARAVAVVAVGVGVLAWMLLQDASGRTKPGLTNSRTRTFQSKSGVCQYAIAYEKDAISRGRDQSVPGTTINVTSLDSGKLGNHFTIASRFLSLGYCCKAKLVTLPPKDPILAPGMFGEGVSGPRHFDFSNAPDVPGFDSSFECNDDYTVGGERAYRAFLPQEGLPFGTMNEKDLALCVWSVRLLDCEAAYYFPKSLDICKASNSSARALALTARVSERRIQPAGNLVIHVQSGDFFRSGKAHSSYGQPPLSYYIGVINSCEWHRVDVVTYGPRERDENPVVPVLRMLFDMGTWPNTDFNIHVDRSIEVDLQAMLCGDALATSRSTLGELTMYHTRATTIFLSSSCDGYEGAFGHTARRLLAARSKRDEVFEVHGVKLRPEAPKYKLYESAIFTDIDGLEMLEYPGVAGVEHCIP